LTKLEGKIAIVTGAAGGIGQAIVRRFIAAGAKVVITDIDAEAIENFATNLGCTGLVQDISDEGRWREIISETVTRLGKLDILVNNAGFVGMMDRVTPEDTRLEDIRRVHRINFEGGFLGCRAAIPAMRSAGGGSIVNISSITALTGTPMQTAYAASKAAVGQLTKSVALHGARDGIRCNAIYPGQIDTGMIDLVYREVAAKTGAEAEQVRAMSSAMVPMGRIGTADEIAAAALYLASDESSYVTGASLVVDGGMMAGAAPPL
jgi:NAD(P)-dependent dehydrogenase (short-subunit alcohol dehydrogenase family)